MKKKIQEPTRFAKIENSYGCTMEGEFSEKDLAKFKQAGWIESLAKENQDG
jgi:hypothetical protein